MPGERSLSEVLRNALNHSDLPFRDFVELALYHPEFGYYARPESPVGREGDFITSPLGNIPPAESRLLINNELFDALPFARLVQRRDELHELWVTERDGVLDWTEHEADPRYDDYFAERGIELDDGQFADVSLEWP